LVSHPVAGTTAPFTITLYVVVAPWYAFSNTVTCRVFNTRLLAESKMSNDADPETGSTFEAHLVGLRFNMVGLPVNAEVVNWQISFTKELAALSSAFTLILIVVERLKSTAGSNVNNWS